MSRPGRGIVRAGVAGTAVFAATAGVAAAVPGAGVVALVVSLGLFGAGSVVFLFAYSVAVRRSRRDQIDLAGLFFLSGSAAPGVRRTFLGCLAVQVVVAVTTAAIRPNTSLAFGVLAPVYGLAVTALWGARHGRFRRRPPPARPRRRSSPPAPPPAPPV